MKIREDDISTIKYVVFTIGFIIGFSVGAAVIAGFVYFTK
jgi:hypothetical protein